MADMTIPDSVVGHPLLPLAKTMATMPDNQNPVMSPVAMDNAAPHLQENAEIIKKNPDLMKVATRGKSMSYGEATDSQVGISQTLFKRLPNVRHEILGFAPAVFGAAGMQVVKGAPQRRFKGNNFYIGTASPASTTIANMVVGVLPQYAAASQESLEAFNTIGNGSFWDWDVCEVGQVITYQATVTAAGTVYSCATGEVLDGRAYTMLRSPLKRIATAPVTVANGASATIQVTPQVRFKARKLMFETTANAPNFIVTSFLVGITPQTLSNDPFPCDPFSDVSNETWLDCDEAYVGNIMSVTVTNVSGAPSTLAMSLMGDVNPADLVAQYKQ